MSSKKSKKSRGGVENPGGGENREPVAAATSSKIRPPRKPMGTLSERLADKADHVYALINNTLQLMAKRSVPEDVLQATKTFWAQVDAWREKVFGLKSSGWQPVESDNKDIVKGDHLQIAPDMRETYQYIFDALGVAPGEEDLVAGLVVSMKRSSRILVKKLAVGAPGDLDGLGRSVHSPEQVFGYVSRSHLVRRPAHA
jgi:hypothetical protein